MTRVSNTVWRKGWVCEAEATQAASADIAPFIAMTDGAKYVADNAGAYWLLDEIAIVQPYEKAVADEEFQVWTLKVTR